MDERKFVLSVKNDLGEWVHIPALKGNGIESIVFNEDGTLTVTETDGTVTVYDGVADAITAAEAATAAATSAASAATSAASTATGAAGQATSAATAANSAADSATSAASSATSAAGSANTAAASATSAATAATTAATNANEKATMAQEAATAADAAREGIQSDLAAKAEKSALDSTNREVSLLRKAIEGQLMEIEEDHTAAYTKILPSGVIGVGVNSVGGKSLVENQINNNTETISADGLTITRDTDGTYIFNGTATSNVTLRTDNTQIANRKLTVTGHKYLLRGCTDGNVETWQCRYYIEGSITNVPFNNAQITTPIIVAETDNDRTIMGVIRIYSGSVMNNVRIFPEIVDLTTMFGSTVAETISTAEDAYALGLSRNHISPGQRIISADCDEVVSEGFNIWDEQWEVGTINGSNGALQSNANNIRSKNYIPVDPSTSYYFHYGTANTRVVFAVYDENKTYISTLIWGNGNRAVTTPSNARYAKFGFYAQDTYVNYGNTYKNDICINVSQTDTTKTPHNGQYLPYMTPDSMTIPQGLRTDHPLISARNSYDDYNFETMKGHGNDKSVNLGGLSWTYNGSEFYANMPSDGVIVLGGDAVPNFTSAIYEVKSYNAYNAATTGVISMSSNGLLRFKDTSHTGADLSSGHASWLENKYLNYELKDDSKTEYDLTPYFPVGFSPLLEAEAGGSITFHQDGDTEFPVPNSTDYFVKTTPSVA